VPEVLVPDQLRSAVARPCRDEPEINATFAELGRHYGCAIIPARPRKPRDKAAVEAGVQLAQRWILACLRHERFHSLGALNARIRELLDRLNARTFQKRDGSRRAAFDTLDRPAMRPLPPQRFELGEWKLGVTVGIDYCVAFDHRVYSVPVALMGRHVDVRATATMVEIFHAGTRVAVHVRAHGARGHASIDPAHRPRAHRDDGDWPPARMIAWGASMGPTVGVFIETMLTQAARPELRYRAALGVLRLGTIYGHARLDAACRRALDLGSPSYRSVAGILKHGLERGGPAAPPATPTPAPTPTAAQVRGGHYFDREEDDDDA
jgi:transposase